MTPDTWERLFGYSHAFDHPVTVGIIVGVVGAFLVAAPLMAIVFRWRAVEQGQREELWKRYRSWLVSVGEGAATGSPSAPPERASSGVTCAHAGSTVTANRRPAASGAAP